MVSEIDWMVGRPVCSSGWVCEEEEEGEGEVRSQKQRRKDTPHIKVSEEEVIMLKGYHGARGPVESLNVPSVRSLINKLGKSKSSMHS